MHNICARFAQDCTSFSNVQYMLKICTKLYFFLQCAIYAQDLHKIVLLSPTCNICARVAQDGSYFSNAQYKCKICTRLFFFPQIFPMRNICKKIAQVCTFFSDVQYMREICTRLFFLLQCTIYAQDLQKIVVISPMRNICS